MSLKPLLQFSLEGAGGTTANRSSGGLHVPHARSAGANGQQFGFPRPVFPHRKFFSPDYIRFWTPGRLPILPWPLGSPIHQLLHADDAGRTFAPPNLRPPAAQHLFWWAQLRHQLPIMLLCCRHRFVPSAMLLVGEECGMDFAFPLQPHKITVVMLFQLINPADARRA